MSVVFAVGILGWSGATALVLLRRPQARTPSAMRRARVPHPQDRIAARGVVPTGPGHFVGRMLGRLFRRRPDEARDRAIGRVVLIAAGAALLHPVLGLAAAVGGWCSSVLDRRRRSRRRHEELADATADVIDLFAVSLLSGHNVVGGLRHVAGWVDGELGDACRHAVRQIDHGRPVVDALETLADDIGAPVRPLVAALIASERFGSPITESLARLGAESRADRRRRAEAAARRLPVVLLFPLVVCVLPAFLLVTVVPVVVDTFSTFDVLGTP